MVQIAYGIGLPDPISINVETYDTITPGYTEKYLSEVVMKAFNLKPGRIIESLDLQRPIFTQTTLYGHFIKTSEDFKWENPLDLTEYKKEQTN